MILDHDFEIDADSETVWALLDDLGRVIPCMPGATFSGFDGENARASVTVKVGPITSNFEGRAHFDTRDQATGTAIIVAKGKDKRGQATANARISAHLVPVTAERTRVELSTDLDITGRLAQFGRGVIVDISNRLLTQFVANLRDELGGPGHSPDAVAAASKRTRTTEPAEASPTTRTASADGGAAVSMGPLLSGMAGAWLRDHGLALAVGGALGAAVTSLLRRRPVLVVVWLAGPRDEPTD